MSEFGNGTELKKIPNARDDDDSNTNNEKVKLLQVSRRVSPATAIRLRTAAIVVSWISLLITLVQGIFAIVLALKDDSASILGFGIEALLDTTTSIVVLWRFYSTELYSEYREKRACVVIGIIFMVASAFLGGKSLFSFFSGIKPSKSPLLLIVAIVNGVVNLIMGICKLSIGYYIESKTLMTDSLVTLMGSIASFAAVLAIELYFHDFKMWYIDSIFGVICSLFLFIYAIVLFWHNCEKVNRNVD